MACVIDEIFPHKRMEFKKSYTIHLTNVLFSICCAVVPTLGGQRLKKNSALSVLK